MVACKSVRFNKKQRNFWGEINQGKSTHKVRGKERGGGPLSPSRVPHARLRKKITKLVPATQAVVSSFTL